MRAVPKPDGVAKDTKRLARRRGKYAEAAIAKKLGGRKVMFSGAGVMEKGDVRLEDTYKPCFLEVKFSGTIDPKTGAHSVSFQAEWAEKTLLDARAAGCLPIIALRFANLDETLYVMADTDVEELLRQSKQLREVLLLP